ncbi:UDP-glucuronosyltransferase 1-1-like protein [Turdus rufiventris]|nr:UDP-glucuronosyltransferase 1-1-like protein [Turdus rufiventris]
MFLNQSGFDAVLTDPFFMCGAILAHHLSLPLVFFMRGLPCNLHFSAAEGPSPLSYIPRTFSFNSDSMTFFQRVENALISLLELDYCNGLYGEALKLSSEVLQRDVSLTDLLNSAVVSIMRFDFVFEYPRPVMPNMVFIGGVNCAKEKPLPKYEIKMDDGAAAPFEGQVLINVQDIPAGLGGTTQKLHELAVNRAHTSHE